MVRPVNSKRKLFNNNKEQFKENEPTSLRSNSPITNTKGSSGKTYEKNEQESLNKKDSSPGESVHDIQKANIYVNFSKISDLDDVSNVLTPSRTAMPMSERQQIALLMQLSSPSPTNKNDINLSDSHNPCTPLNNKGSIKRNERGETPLHVASIKGDIDKVSQILSKGANVNATDYAGWSALHEACNRGFTYIASLLIKAGADVNAKGLDNDTPLHDACINNHYKIAKLLIKSGAKTDLVNRRGKSPRDVCRSAHILSLIEQAHTGFLEDFDDNEIENSYVSGIEKEKLYFSRELTNSEDCGFSISTKEVEMSRRTPPNNKLEEKPNSSLNNPSTTQTVSGNCGDSSITTGNGSSNGNGRPGSPRVTLRLPPVQRTPEKSQQRTHDSKEPVTNEDVYEFRCSKDESKGEDKEDKTDGVKQESPSSSDTKCDKRPREDDDEEELKKRKKKEENKETTRGRGNNNRPSTSDKSAKTGPRNNGNNSANKVSSVTGSTSNTIQTSNASTASSTVSGVSSSSNTASSTVGDHRKSPVGSAANSPKPANSGPSLKNSEKGDNSDGEEVKNEASSGAPKVPPLKIVLAPCGGSEQETSSQNGKNGNNRQLPYVVNSSSGNPEDKDIPTPENKDSAVIIKEEPHVTSASTTSNSISTITSTSSSGNSGINCTTSVNTTSSPSSVVSSVAASSSSTNSSINCISGSVTSTTNTSEKFGGTRITRSQRGGGSEESAPVKIEPKLEEPSSSSITSEIVHPRKRKLKMKEPEVEQPTTTSLPEQPITNCYDMFLKIRKQVERRRKLLFPVQPKPPQGFKDYLMNRCSYVLANNSNSHLSIPIIPPPPSLSQAMKDLFNEQEQERHKLKLQQLVEKEKLVLSVEQEILRVHGRAARALANQVLPFSVCTILKDEEVYNIISAEQEEKDRTARSRYNGRLFLSWLQDVDDKWEKIKEAMVLRHHNEAESLHAVQKMDWEWKQKELGLVEPSVKAQIDEMHVPMVQVADFDLLPA